MTAGVNQGIFIGVGSNIDAERNIVKALDILARQVQFVDISTFYETEPIGAPGTPKFLNGVVAIDTHIPPRPLKFEVLRLVESALDRARSGDKNAPRTIDLDVLLYHDLTVDDDALRVPDPDIYSRNFLACCLAELAPGAVVEGVPIQRLVDESESDGMREAAELTQRLRGRYLSK